jgi:SAM-dependent methyltransferase
MTSTESPLLQNMGRFHGRFVFSRRLRVLARVLAPLLPPGLLADVGCGDGSLALAIARIRPDIEPRGFDVLARPGARIPVERFDGEHLPLADRQAAAALLVDVLHHAADPAGLLRECARVADVVIVKDHIARGRFDVATLSFMDWFGNRPHGVRLEYRYFDPEEWKAAWRSAGLAPTSEAAVHGLYPFPVSLVFGRRLHFAAKLERAAAPPAR